MHWVTKHWTLALVLTDRHVAGAGVEHETGTFAEEDAMNRSVPRHIVMEGERARFAVSFTRMFVLHTASCCLRRKSCPTAFCVLRAARLPRPRLFLVASADAMSCTRGTPVRAPSSPDYCC